MYPTLRDGDEILVDPRAFLKRSPEPGEVVLALHPFKAGVRMVKRVWAVMPDGRVVLRGDEKIESSDSRSFGPVSRALIVGLVTGRAP